MLQEIDYVTFPRNVKSLKEYYYESSAHISREVLQKLSEPSYELQHDYNGVIVKPITHNIPQGRERESLEY